MLFKMWGLSISPVRSRTSPCPFPDTAYRFGNGKRDRAARIRAFDPGSLLL